MMNKPFLKWAGGKSRILPQLLPLLPAGNRLVEPFAGSCSIFLNTNYSEYWISDYNPDLIALYLVLQDETTAFDFIFACRAFFNENGLKEEFYYQVRRDFNSNSHFKTPVMRAAAFVYLNRHCFNGVCRYNRSGEFNTPFGKYKNVYFPLNEIKSFIARLKSTTPIIAPDDFENVMSWVSDGNVVYCDPPYLNNFSGYTAKGFTINDHQRLVDAARNAVELGASVVISNSIDAVDLYDGFTIHEITAQRSINSTGDRTAAKEIVAVLTPQRVAA